MAPRKKAYKQIYRPVRAPFLTEGNHQRPFTPRKPKLKSHPTLQRPTLHVYTDPMLDSELDGAIVYNQPAEPMIRQIFPDEILPCPVEHLLSFFKTKLGSESLQYSISQKRWLFLPEMTNPDYKAGVKENLFSAFVNGIGNAAADFPFKNIDFSMQRFFTSKFSQKPLLHTDSDLERKPDVVAADIDILFEILAELGDGDGLAWPNIKLIVEIKSKFTPSAFKNKVHTDLANKVIALFDQQPNRRFVPTLALVGYEAYFSVWNRAGVVHSQNFNINKNPELILRIIMGYLFAKDVDLGFDPTMYVAEDEKWHIKANGMDFEFVHQLWSSQMINGRATWCWVVKCGDKYYVLKDSWVINERWPDEVYFFKKAHEASIKNLPTMWFYEDVEIRKGVLDSTDGHRGVYPELYNRIHRRIFFEEEGVPIYMFQTKRELIKAIIDIIDCHHNLCKEARILHRDISIYNLLLLRRRLLIVISAFANDTDRPGLLVDLDYALDLDLSLEQILGPRGERTGTPPFMAVEILWNPEKGHKACHDLESFFYVLVYICTVYCGPLGEETKSPRPEFMNDWLYPTDYKTLGHIKNSQLSMRPSDWRQQVSDYFPPYWNCLKKCILRLRRVVRRGNATHETFLFILRETLDDMPLDDKSTAGDDDITSEDDMDDDEESNTMVGSDGYMSPTPLPSNSGSLKRVLPDTVDLVHHSSRLKRIKPFRSMATNDMLARSRRRRPETNM